MKQNIKVQYPKTKESPSNVCFQMHTTSMHCKFATCIKNYALLN